MTIDEMKKAQQDVAVVVGLLRSVNVEEALVLMERVAKQAKVADPVMWAKAKDGHERMTKMMRAALVFQRTVGGLRAEMAKPSKLIIPESL